MPNPRVELPAALAAALHEEARQAAPRECCGLLEGRRAEGVYTILALHPVRNLSDDPDHFEIDPGGHIAAVKIARANGTTILGCYHSHPRGSAQPSASDLAGAGEENFLWLIVADEAIRAFFYSGRVFVGADCVTSSE